jgi:hypothetical protein
MKILIERLNKSGGAVYRRKGDFPIVACWFGEKAGRLWYHLGDKPHWGPLLKELKEFYDYGISTESGFFACIFEEAVELRLGESIDHVENQREIMTRDQAIALLGDPPDEGFKEPAARGGIPDVEP